MSFESYEKATPVEERKSLLRGVDTGEKERDVGELIRFVSMFTLAEAPLQSDRSREASPASIYSLFSSACCAQASISTLSTLPERPRFDDTTTLASSSVRLNS